MVSLNKNTTDGTDKFVTTYYVRDPQGNVLAVYEHKHGESGNGTFTLAEQHLYGSGRLGMKKRDLALNVANASESTPAATHYELTNHLGNVMAVISDKASDTNEPTVVSLSDYYPFGMMEPGRSWNAGDYRFGYTGHEKENDLADGVYTTEYRLLDTRLGRWMSVDPVFHAGSSSYLYCLGNPMAFWDPDGRIKRDEKGNVIFDPIDYDSWSYGGGHSYNLAKVESVEGLSNYTGIDFGFIKEEEREDYIVMEAFKSIKGNVYFDNSDEPIEAHVAKENRLYFVLYNLKEDKVVAQGKAVDDIKFVKKFENTKYNCGGKLADCKFTIQTSQFTIDELCEKDNYRKLGKNEKPKKGDLGIYYEKEVGLVEHIELFKRRRIDIKGGASVDKPVKKRMAGDDPKYGDRDKYEYVIIRKEKGKKK